MPRPRLSQAGPVLILGLLITSVGCGMCNPRHGMILRGDWSLELNRVPWLNSRTQNYDETGGDSCPAGMAVEPVPSAAAAAAPVSCLSSIGRGCPSRGLGCRTCAPPGAADSTSPAQQLAYSRFHPVPTRPVFTPWNCPTPDPQTRAPQNGPPSQEQPQREVIPTPEVSQSAVKPTTAEGAVTNACWVFQP